MDTNKLTEDLSFLGKSPDVKKMIHFGSSYFKSKDYTDIDIAIFLNKNNNSDSVKSLISNKIEVTKIDNYECYDRKSRPFCKSKYHFVIVPSDYDRDASIIKSIEKGRSLSF